MEDNGLRWKRIDIWQVPVASWELEHRLSHPEWEKKRAECWQDVDRCARSLGTGSGGWLGSSRSRLIACVSCYYTRLQWWHRLSQLLCQKRARLFSLATISHPSRVFVSQLRLPSVKPLASKTDEWTQKFTNWTPVFVSLKNHSMTFNCCVLSLNFLFHEVPKTLKSF